MSRCTETAKPQISILMAIYEPRMDWLREQLLSLDAQTYPNLKLYIRDDCSPKTPYAEIEACVRDCIKKIPYTICRNEKNLGSNGTFELLTQEADGDYFSYCDQDDIWLPEKLEILEREISNNNATLVCSDMYIIDGAGNQVADSITKIRRHHIFRSGSDITDTLWYSNFASGCALLADSRQAKAAIPFNPYMYYDHYITLYCANQGLVVSIPEPLILHREHGENQSSTLQGIVDKHTYREKRIDNTVSAVEWLNERFECDAQLKEILAAGQEWMRARQAYCRGNRSAWRTVWKYRRYSPMASLFELVMPVMPMPLFKLALWMSRKNYI